ncbi:hypothetical protein Taro_035381, partial [Colocasia esculenta]|nr:hypothetical protein [Colocasia esculenta]
MGARTSSIYSDSLDYANYWRSPHAEPPSHSDRKSCLTRREISSPGHGYGCPNIADIRLPRLRKSLAEPTHGADQSQRSEVVFNLMRDLLPRSWIWVPEHRRYSHPLRFIPTPSAKELGITFRTGIGIALCDHNSESALRDGRQGIGFAEFRSGAKIPPRACILVHRLPYPPVGRGYLFTRGSEPPARPQFRIGTSTRSVNGRIRRFPARRPNSSLGARSQAADAIAYGHCIAQIGITFRSVIGIAYKTPIWIRHSEALDAPLLAQAIRRRFGVENPSFRTLKLRFYPTISHIPRRSTRRWFCGIPFRGQNSPQSVYTSTPTAVPSSLTRIFIHPGVGTAREAPIQNRHFDPVGKWSHSEIYGPAPKFLSGSAPTRGAAQSQRSEVMFNSSRDILPRSWIWVPEHRRYSHPLCSDSFDYANRWRSHARSRPVTVIGSRVQLDARSPPQRLLQLRESLAEPHAEPPSHSDRKSCSTRRKISSS